MTNCEFDKAVESGDEIDDFVKRKWRYVRAIMEAPELTNRAKIAGNLLVTRYLHQQSGNRAYPGQARLAKSLGKSERTVRRALRELVQERWLFENPGGARGVASEFTVDWHEWGDPTPRTKLADGEVEKASRGGQDCPPSPDKVVQATPDKSVHTRERTKNKNYNLRKAHFPNGDSADASPLSAHKAAGGSPSNDGRSGKAKKESRHGNGASIPKPRLGQKHRARKPPTAAERIEHKLISECQMNKPDAWTVLIDVSDSEIKRIAGCLENLSGQELLKELGATVEGIV